MNKNLSMVEALPVFGKIMKLSCKTNLTCFVLSRFDENSRRFFVNFKSINKFAFETREGRKHTFSTLKKKWGKGLAPQTKCLLLLCW